MLDAKILKAKACIQAAISRSDKQVIAFSGGKDAIVTAHLCEQLGIVESVCEVSWYFEKQMKSIRRIAKKLKLDVCYLDSLDINWLRKNKHVVFSEDSKVRSWSFSARQQRTVKKFAKDNNYDCMIYGRRTEENTVPSHIYRTKAGLQCHPLRDWIESDIWEYFDKFNIEKPWIYSTKFGEFEGNAPFYTFNPKHAGMSVKESWELITSLDSRYTEGLLK